VSESSESSCEYLECALVNVLYVRDLARSMANTHRLADFQAIAATGINTLRIPVGTSS
jgi:hypothetical protein